MVINNMEHMDFLEAVQAQDLATLRYKEGTYRGSWKKRGGVGAFMMMARKWDRLENILPGPSTIAYDIFGHIAASADGADGGVLAEVRDLRQYLLLIEAEMMSSGVVASPKPAITKNIVLEPKRPVPRTPEDGGQHESLVPWVVWDKYLTDNYVPEEYHDKFWHMRAPNLNLLEPHVVSDRLPRSLRMMYDLTTVGWVLRIRDCPADAREYFPNLQRELNMMEFDQRPEWQRHLYRWNTEGNKYVLSTGYEAWHVETE